jgi:hypothetical protein
MNIFLFIRFTDSIIYEVIIWNLYSALFFITTVYYNAIFRLNTSNSSN